MLAVILSGHGAFASGLAQAVHQVIGEQPQFRFTKSVLILKW